MAGKAHSYPSISDPHRAELLVLDARDGLLFAWELGFIKNNFGGDAKNVIRSI